MNITNIIAIAIIVIVVGGAIAYIVRAKKRGQRCIGCPSAKSCQGSCSCCPSESTCKNDNKNASDNKTK